ncbi:MAG: hypothetical protein VX726_08045 [Planctomycetota bacterium]|nr:hypothetical protein [Planctomycetota bacterium]
MTEAEPPISPSISPSGPRPSRPAGRELGPSGVLACQVVALPAMASWPLLALFVEPDLLQGDHWILAVGGVTSVPIGLATAFAGVGNQWLLGTPAVAAWGLAWLLPPWLLRRRLRSRGRIVAMIAGQSGFSALQAGFGLFLMAARSV